MFVGIDPGLEGAVAIVRDGGAHAAPSVVFHDAPAVETKTSTGKRRRILDAAEMARILRAVDQGSLVTIEHVGPMPKQGVVSTFTFGMGYGLWQGICAALGLRYQLVHSTRWKGQLMAGQPKVKEAVVPHASRLYPGAAAELWTERRRALTGRADALLLAHYGRLGLR